MQWSTQNNFILVSKEVKKDHTCYMILSKYNAVISSHLGSHLWEDGQFFPRLSRNSFINAGALSMKVLSGIFSHVLLKSKGTLNLDEIDIN